MLCDPRLSPAMAHRVPFTCPSSVAMTFSSRSLRSVTSVLKTFSWPKYLKSCSRHNITSCICSALDLL
ncbi:hypothetical protein LDENG_00160060 [Lucifuga dentata]|nr:hypothetical protein LDENG_00160060 [Lucifuga dentata]